MPLIKARVDYYFVFNKLRNLLSHPHDQRQFYFMTEEKLFQGLFLFIKTKAISRGT